jgi:hypothetical protein
MGLEIVKNTMDDIAGCPFTDDERRFILEFAFKTDDKGFTDRLIAKLAECGDAAASEKIIGKYAELCGERHEWVNAAENLLVAMEVLRIYQEQYLSELEGKLEAVQRELAENGIPATGIISNHAVTESQPNKEYRR